RLQHRRSIPAHAERRREREHEAVPLLIERSAVHEIESPLRVRDGAPLRRRFRIAGDIAAAVLVEPLAEAGQHEVPDTLETLEPSHRFRRRLEQPPRGVLLGRGGRHGNEDTRCRARGDTQNALQSHDSSPATDIERSCRTDARPLLMFLPVLRSYRLYILTRN